MRLPHYKVMMGRSMWFALNNLFMILPTVYIRMEIMLKRLFALIPAGLTYLFAGQAMADVEMRSKPWQMWLQEPMSPSAEKVHDLNLFLMLLETAIVIFVLALLVYILIRFSEKNNPVPSKTTHNTLLEVVWTAIPTILVFVADRTVAEHPP